MVIDNLNKTNYISYLKKGTDTATGQNVGIITKINPSINLYFLSLAFQKIVLYLHFVSINLL